MGKKYTPILPYDGSLNDNFIVYDDVKYKCNVDLYQTESPVKLHHESVVKYYSCVEEKKPMRIGGD